MCVCAPAGPSCEGIGVTGHGALHPEGVPGQTGSGVEVWRGIPFGRRGIRISMPKVIWRGNLAWDPLLVLWRRGNWIPMPNPMPKQFWRGNLVWAWDLVWES